MLLVCLRAEPLCGGLSQLVQINSLPLVGERVLVKLRQLEYILYQGYHAAGFVADILRKARNVLRLYDTADQHIGNPVNSGERSFQLVGNI